MNDLYLIFKDFGFPALAFGMMFWLVKDTIAKNTAAINNLADYLKNPHNCPNNTRQ